MIYKRLGNTEVKVPAVGQGTAGSNNHLNVELGIKQGMTFIDTAEAYDNGRSEEVVGKAIEGIRDKVFIATKVSPEHLSYEGVLQSSENSLHRLKTKYIDLYQVHWTNPKIPIEETMSAMKQLVTLGKISYIGVSNFSLTELKKTRDVLGDTKIVSIQVEYNLFDRTIEKDILPYCEQKRITTIAYSPLYHGRIAGDEKRISLLQTIAKKYNKTTAQIALNWLVAHPSVIVIPKANNEKHIRENASSVDFILAEEDIKEIDKIFAQECIYVPTNRIRVITGGEGNRQVYSTVEEAIENKLAFVPSPMDLAQSIQEGNVLKPVRVIKSTDTTGKYDYDLIEGRVRYWAWVIAYNNKRAIPVYIRNN